VPDVDVLVVGARCAGSPLATFLARRGVRVCAVDRTTFPSELPSTHAIQPIGVQVLRRLGVLDELWERGAGRLDRVTLRAGRAELSSSFDDAPFGAPGMCVRRVTLDDVLVRAAVRAGVDVRTGTNVTGLLREDDRVVGVETNHGPITASLVVGADGPHSRVAALAGAREYGIAPAARMFAWGYFRGVPRSTHIQLRRADEYAYLVAPTDDDLCIVVVVPALERKPDFAGDRDAAYAAGIAAWPELEASLAGAEREGPVRIVSSWHGYFREATGPGWALVGDAGHFKDPTPGQGISDALRQAERLAAAIAPVHLDPLALDESLRRWWKWRDRDAREMYWFGSDLGTAGPIPPVREKVLMQLSASERDTVRLLRVLNHELPPSKVFTARQLVRAAIGLSRGGEVPTAQVAREVVGLVRDSVTQARLSPPRGGELRPTRRAAAPRGSAWARAAGSAVRS